MLFGQDDAVDKIAKAIRRNRVGLVRLTVQLEASSSSDQTGVGKTELPNN